MTKILPSSSHSVVMLQWSMKPLCVATGTHTCTQEEEEGGGGGKDPPTPFCSMGLVSRSHLPSLTAPGVADAPCILHHTVGGASVVPPNSKQLRRG